MNRNLWRPTVLTLFLAFMIVPVLATALFSISVRWDRSLWPEGLTLEWWQKVTAKTAFRRALWNSLWVSGLTVVISAALVAPTAWLVHSRLKRARWLVEVLAILPFGLPGVVLALGLIRLYAGNPVMGMSTLLIAACVTITLPFMYRAIANALEALDIPTLTEAAQSLGATRGQIFLRVILPNIRAGLVNGCLLVFAATFAEFALANLLIGTRMKTFPIYLVEFTRFDARQASALACLSFAIAWIISLAILWVAGRRRKGGAGAG